MLLSAETKLLHDLKLPLPYIHMASSSILGTLVYFPALQNILKRLTLVFLRCLGPEVTTQGESPKKHPISADVGICKSHSAGELTV